MNETIFLEILPEISTIFEKSNFSDSLCIFVSDLRFSRGNLQKKIDDVAVRIDNVECLAKFGNCRLIRQFKMDGNREMMFGVFGEDFESTSPMSPELAHLNPKIILPKNAENFIEIRNFELELTEKSRKLYENIGNLFQIPDRENRIKIRKDHRKNLIFLHLDLENEQTTRRSAIFETIFLIFEFLDFDDVTSIRKMCIQFVHFGKIRISVDISSGKVEIFNFYGSLCGIIDGINGKNRENDGIFIEIPEFSTENSKSAEFLLEILQKMKVSTENLNFSEPLAYIGIDSLRILELEFYISNSESFRNFNFQPPFLAHLKTLGEVLEFLDSAGNPQKNEENLEFSTGNRQIIDKFPSESFKIPLSSSQKRIMFMSEFQNSEQFEEKCILKSSAKFEISKISKILNLLIMQNSILRTDYFDDFQFLLSATECHVAILERQESLKKFKFQALQCFVKSENFSELFLIFHHIAIDGRSLSIFYRQFRQLWDDYDDSTVPKAPKLQYLDYCRDLDKDSKSEENLEFWKNYLKEDLEYLPTDFDSKSLKAETIIQNFPEKLAEKFKNLQYSGTNFQNFLQIVQVSTQEIFGIQNFNIGYAVDTRKFEFFETMGCFTNVAIYRSNSTFDLSHFEKHVDFEKLSKIKLPTDFQIFLISDKVEMVGNKKKVHFSDKDEISLETLPANICKYEIVIYLREFQEKQKLQLEVQYACEIFRKDTIQALIDHVFRSINSINRPNRQIIEKLDFPNLPIYKSMEKEKLKIRHLGENLEISQSEILSRSRSIQILQIRKFANFCNEQPIVLKLDFDTDRKIEIVKNIMAIWNCGFYPVPVHQVPETFQSCITLEDKVQNFDSKIKIFPKSTTWDIAYVTATSGSTGIPKLVATEFLGHSNLARNYAEVFQINEKDTICQTVDPSFDIFFADIVKTFSNQARLLLTKERIPDKSEILESSNAYLMPALISRIDLEVLKNLETLQFGGETLAGEHLLKILEVNKRLKVFQEFGLTEQTVYSAFQRLRKSGNTRLIGKPYPNIGLKVLSGNCGDPTNFCLRGSLLLEGVGIMRGYFLSNFSKFSKSELNTGDDVEIRNGILRFIGRRDSQVKVRGFRIDLVEIESVALSSNLINSCVCILIDKTIVLFYKSIDSSSPIDIENRLDKYLNDNLIYYKVPSLLKEIEEFPMTRTGKIDRKALENFKNSGNSLEKSENTGLLLKKWLEHYSEVEIPSENADIFKIGVDSISVMLTVQKLRAHGLEVNVRSFFEKKTLKGILETISGTSGTSGNKMTSSESSVTFMESSGDTGASSETFGTSEATITSSETSGASRITMTSSTNAEAISETTESPKFIDLNHIQKRILFVSRMSTPEVYRMQFRIPNFENSGLATNTVIQNNKLLRSKLTRIDGEFRFEVLSATESFRSLKLAKSRSSEYETLIWKDNEKNDVILSIHHIICDQRSLQILQNQLSNFKTEFENNFELEPANNNFPQVENFPILDNFKTEFEIGARKSSRIQFSLKVSNHKIAYDYCKAISETFHVESENFHVAMTFSNRTANNWNTVSMFANTLPVKFSKIETFEVFSRRISEISENFSNCQVPPVNLEFAVNFQKVLEDCEKKFGQFPMLLTYSELESSGILEFDEAIINRFEAEKVLEHILGVKKENELEKVVETFRKILKNEKIDENSDFFQFGGHSLLAMKFVDQISEIFKKEIDLKTIFENSTPRKFWEAIGSFQKLEIISKNFKFPLSPQQSQMMYLSQLTQDSTEYQLPFIQPFPSTMDPYKIHESLLKTIQKQTIFRTVFEMDKNSGEVNQQVVSITECFISFNILSFEKKIDLDRKIRELCAEKIPVFAEKPLIKACFLSCKNANKSVAFLHLHHLISDAKSTQIMNSSMREYLGGGDAEKLDYNYLNFCEEAKNDKIPNSEYIESLITGQKLSLERRRAEKCHLDFDPNFSNSGTPFSIFLQATSSILLDFLKIDNCNVAFPTINRSQKTENICGYFLNNLLINTSQLHTLPTVIHENLQYATVIREIRKRKLDRDQIADVYINCRYDLEYDPTDDEQLLSLVPIKLHFPIEFDFDLLGTFWRITMRSDVIGKIDMERILAKISGKLSKSLLVAEKIPLEKENIIYGPRKDFPTSSLPQLYSQFHINEIPNYSTSISRQFLTSTASPLRSDDIIGVIGTQGPETTVRCLAVQYSGAAYLPVDSKYPENRKLEILKDSQFVDDGKALPPIRHPKLRHFCTSTPFSLAYCITTSGTTGKPKSVAINCNAVANLLLSSTISMKVNSKSRIFQFTNFVFDNSVLEICMALASGAELVYNPQESDLFDPKNLEKLEISHCLLFPSLVESISISKIRNLAYWIVGGERLPQRLLDQALELGICVIQNYGPTETTAFAIAKTMKKGDPGGLLGSFPSVNSKFLIDEKSGELLISGIGRMRGYLNRNETFRFENGSFWYQSGDLVRKTEKGIEYVGRTDSQIKIRGFRVELSEIEKVVESHESIKSCRAFFDDVTQQIHVFYVMTSSIDNDVIRKHCEEHLEKHKIPAKFQKVDHFPLTANSKIDRKKLMEIEKSKKTTKISTNLAKIWRQLLPNSPPEIQMTSHFFSLGGHSLLLLKLRHLIEIELKIELTIPEIIQNLQFSQMARILEEKCSIIKKTLIFFPALYGGCTAYLKLITFVQQNFDVVLLDEEIDGSTVDDVADKYRIHILGKVENLTNCIFIGASSAGTFAFATWQKLQHFEKNQVDTVLLDTGTYWDLIGKLRFENHEKEMLENLKNYEIDEKMAKKMAQDSWKVLEILKNYRPQLVENFGSRNLHILSIDGSDLGWSRFGGNLKVQKISGDHYSMLTDEEHVAEISSILKNTFY